MKKLFEEPILNQLIEQLDMSKDFKELTQKYNYQTLADILNLKEPYDLLKHNGFDYRLLLEFTSFLAKRGLSNHLMPIRE